MARKAGKETAGEGERGKEGHSVHAECGTQQGAQVEEEVEVQREGEGEANNRCID